MKQLILLRHGVAEPHGTVGIADDDRRLTPKGEKKLEAVGEGLVRLGYEFDRIFTSPLPRARQTAEVVAERLDEEDRVENVEILRPGNSASSIRDWVVTRPEKRVMLVGHNPNLTELLGLLIGFEGLELPFDLAKGGLAVLSSNDGESFRLELLITAKTFSRLED
jgi:phosphohistidine phosphatase